MFTCARAHAYDLPSLCLPRRVRLCGGLICASWQRNGGLTGECVDQAGRAGKLDHSIKTIENADGSDATQQCRAPLMLTHSSRVR